MERGRNKKVGDKVNPKYYVVLSNGCIGYVAKICVCDDCKQRGETEWIINNLNDEYLDCIKHSNLHTEILNMAMSIEDLSHEHERIYILKMIADVYMDVILQLETDRR